MKKYIIVLGLVCGLLTFSNVFAAPADDFVTTWKTDNAGASGSTSITIPTSGGGYNYDVDWDNDGTFDEFGLTGSVTHDFGVAGTYTIRIQGAFPHIRFNNGGDRLKILDVAQWGTGSWSSMSEAFYGAENMTVTAVDVPDLSGLTDLVSMFHTATSANPDTSGWNVSTVENFSGMFHTATSANPDTSGWDTTSTTAMINMFNGATSANPDTSGWNTGSVTTMENMFHTATSANPDTSGWNTSSVTTFDNMFRDATSANPDTSGWNTSLVTDMTSMFNGATSANPDTSGWNTSNVESMTSMFLNATSANPDTSGWNTTSLTQVPSMFFGATSANPDTSGWDVSSVVNFASMFRDATSATPTTTLWNTSSATTFANMFYGATSANPDTSGWNTAGVTNFASMFRDASSATPDTSSWDTSSALTFSNFFQNATSANPDTSGWDTSNVTSMISVFNGATSANPDTSGWNTGSVNNMTAMFLNATSANPDTSGWNTSSVTTIASMFFGANLANPDVSGWNTSSMSNMASVFRGNAVANPDVSAWNTSNVTAMSNMFRDNPVANPDVSAWDTSSLLNTGSMFQNATSADPDMGAWDVADVTNMSLMFNGAGMSRENYDSALVGWNAQVLQTGVVFSAGSSTYCAEDAHDDITNPGIHNWTVSDGGLDPVCPPADPTVAPDMTAGTDSGSSTTDNITNDTTPDFDVVCSEIGNTMTLYTNNPVAETVLGTHVCLTAAVETMTSAVLVAGAHSITYTDTHMGLASGHSPVLAIVVDTVDPDMSVSIDTITNGIDDPIFTFSGTDDNTVDFFDVTYNTNNGGVGVGAATTDSPVTSPLTLDLDPNESIHTVTFMVYDLAGNNGTKTLIFPPVVNISAPTTLSAAPITDATVTISTPTGNDIDNIVLTPGTTGSTLGTCTGFGGDLTAPYAEPVTCIINAVTATGTLMITAEDSVSGAIGQNNQSFTIDAILPSVTITAPTKTSASAITDTTIQVTDAEGVLAANVTVDGATTATTSAFSCVQTTPMQVDCTISVDTSGDLVIRAVDEASNAATATESSYIIDTVAPIITITAPTKTSGASITNTTITITDSTGVDFGDVTVDAATTAVRSSFACVQTLATQVDCTISIDGSGDLTIRAEDTLGNAITESELGYVISSTAPTVTITAPTKTSATSITDTTIQVIDDLGVLVADVVVDAATTATTSTFSCVQTLATQVDCTISIDSTGDLTIMATDSTANIGFGSELGYTVAVIVSPPSSGGGGGGIRYVCKDPVAKNYSDSHFARHKDSKCIYEATIENPFAGEQCSSDQIVTNNMRRGDKNGQYSSYNNGVVTQVNILQGHMNRLLLDEYGNQASGPVDGIYGPLTTQGVRRLQGRLNQLLPTMIPLVIDGIVGPFTRSAINNSCAYTDSISL